MSRLGLIPPLGAPADLAGVVEGHQDLAFERGIWTLLVVDAGGDDRCHEARAVAPVGGALVLLGTTPLV
jgi:hypothetical protein